MKYKNPFLRKGMVSILIWIFILVCAFGCNSDNSNGNTPGSVSDAEAVRLDMEALNSSSFGFRGTDNLTGVTGNFTLPVAGSHDTTITWLSNNDAVTVSGDTATVTRPSYVWGDIWITLNAVVSKNDIYDTRAFTLIVVANSPDAGIPIKYAIHTVYFDMIYVPVKGFLTGIDDSGTAEVNYDYLIGETEVTYELWELVYTWAVSHGYTFARSGTMGGKFAIDISCVALPPTLTSQHPVTTIGWRDAMVWTNALTEYYNYINGTSYTCAYYADMEYTIPIRDSSNGGLFFATTDYPNPGSFDDPYVKDDATGFRLLTGSEWELAARFISDANEDGDISDPGEYTPGNYASGASADYTDDAASGDAAWYSYNSINGGCRSTREVKGKAPNTLGLYDMSGNVWEWSFDWLAGSEGSSRMGWGGSYNGGSYELQVGLASGSSPYTGNDETGFRLGRTP